MVIIAFSSSLRTTSVRLQFTLGDDSDSFSVQLFHGGGFSGNGNNRVYVDGEGVWYDFCEMDKWSPLIVEDIVEDLGYEMAGRVKVYWLLPGKTIDDGLILIKKDADTNSMISMVEFGQRFLDMYIDHDLGFNGYSLDDVVGNKDVQSSQVIHFSKLPLLDNMIESSSKTVNLDIEEVESDVDSEDSDFNHEIMDSDYDLDDGDDDLFDDYVDGIYDMKAPDEAGGWCNFPREHLEVSEAAFLWVAKAKADIVSEQFRRFSLILNIQSFTVNIQLIFYSLKLHTGFAKSQNDVE
ncbi:hypothetical protein QOZ80_4BG0348920 [Eleusine coracana subsp. coracana]|nr:hypothetical protein QOZ80_4BG0348920 [Eleusine coracana subsp. coracana]